MTSPSRVTNLANPESLLAAAMAAMRAASRIYGGLAVLARKRAPLGAGESALTATEPGDDAAPAWQSIAEQWAELQDRLATVRGRIEQLPTDVAAAIHQLDADAALAESSTPRGPRLAALLADSRFGEGAAEWFYRRGSRSRTETAVERLND